MKPNSEIKAKVQAFIHKYLDISAEDESLIADYALGTWMPLPETVKYLQFVGNYGTGKTRAGAVMAAICRNPIKAAGYVSPMSVVVQMDRSAPCTLILDEANFNFDYEANALFAGMLSVGIEKGSLLQKMVPNAEGSLGVDGFNVFGYKVLLSFRPFDDTSIQARCITVSLSPSEKPDIPRFLAGDFESDKFEIAWALVNAFVLTDAIADAVIYSPISKYIESRFAEGAKEVALVDIRAFIEQFHKLRASNKVIGVRARELGYEMRRRGQHGNWYIQPKGGA